MKFLDFRDAFKDSPIIDIRNGFNTFGSMDRRRLYEWQKKGYIKRLSNNFYLFSDSTISKSLLGFIANKLYSPSYVSLEWALAHYGFIPEQVFQVTSVTTLKTRSIQNETVNLRYTSVKKNLYYGYALSDGENSSPGYLMATPEKAILDFLYCNPHLKNRDDYLGLRMDHSQLAAGTKPKIIRKYLEIAGDAQLADSVKRFGEAYRVKF